MDSGVFSELRIALFRFGSIFDFLDFSPNGNSGAPPEVFFFFF